jgi:sugar/nucleoside kinase (ribokinase family)
VIVIVGDPVARVDGDARLAAGLPAGVAIAAVASGGTAQLVGRVGEDAAGEAVLLDLARHRVGHAAVLRDPVRPTAEVPMGGDDDLAVDADTPFDSPSSAPGMSALDAADLKLAFDYLPEYSVIVVAERLAPAALRVAVDAAAWSGAALVVVGRSEDLDGLPDEATVLVAPEDGDADGSFASMVGTYAAGLDRGEDPRSAFAAASAAVGSTAAD